jgi:glutaminyl-tRNA synthetase
MSDTETKPVDFIRNIISEDLASGKHSNVVTRFPPEPNGYLHIGHAKSICLNFGISEETPVAVCNLRFDDTNPEKEDVEYIEAIKEDVSWLGFTWHGEPHYASDYFDALYAYAVELVKRGKAYVDSLSAQEIREHRGTLTESGKNSPYRDRTVEENLMLLEGMKQGDFDEGTHILRAKIDMASPNMNMRDPAIYRIRKADHHRTGDAWCIYPMYDFTHCLSDAMEGITHSLCTLEFADHRPLYDWVLETLQTPCHPRQIEFSRLNISFTVLSKRKLLQLVDQGHVSGWDDPRMPTICGIRRRGYTPEALRNFCRRIGISKKETRIDYTILEDCVREDLNEKAPRVMGVLDPLKVTVTNYPEDLVEEVTANNHPQNPEMGTRTVPFSRELYIEKSDFMEEPPKKFFRLGPGREVRLRSSYYITCTDVVKNDEGEVVELLCTYDPESKGGSTPDGRKVKGTLHWVSARHAVSADVRVYDRLFNVENPEKEGDSFLDHLNPDSLTVLTDCKIEPSVATRGKGAFFQFERTGYFTIDPVDSTPEKLVFNRTATLRDAWAKMNK